MLNQEHAQNLITSTHEAGTHGERRLMGLSFDKDNNKYAPKPLESEEHTKHQADAIEAVLKCNDEPILRHLQSDGEESIDLYDDPRVPTKS